MQAKYEGAAFTERFGPWAAIAGGSDGIGRAFAEVLAERGLDLVLIARDPKKLEATARAIREAHGVEVRVASQPDRPLPPCTHPIPKHLRTNQEALHITTIISSFHAGAISILGCAVFN